MPDVVAGVHVDHLPGARFTQIPSISGRIRFRQAVEKRDVERIGIKRGSVLFDRLIVPPLRDQIESGVPRADFGWHRPLRQR